MVKKVRRTCPPEEILDQLSPELQALANRLRELIKKLVPDAEEAGMPGWKLVGYRNRRYFGFIAPMPDHVRVGFEHGATLPDPKGILEGSTKQVKHVEFRTEADYLAKLEGLTELIETAAFRAKFD